MSEPTFYTPSEVATRLEVTETTLARWREQGKGPPWERVGERYRYPKAAFATWDAARPRGGEQREGDA